MLGAGAGVLGAALPTYDDGGLLGEGSFDGGLLGEGSFDGGGLLGAGSFDGGGLLGAASFDGGGLLGAAASLDSGAGVDATPVGRSEVAGMPPSAAITSGA
ncbi:MAG: hypothetical protein JWP11_1673, partial [Frankiales bacterium]|nr:hypothetical protein [Frankiales bacterium]